MLCCTVLCCAVLYCTILCYTALCCAVLCCAALCCAVLYCAALHCAALCYAVLCCTVLCSDVLGCAVCCHILCCAVLCWLCCPNLSISTAIHCEDILYICNVTIFSQLLLLTWILKLHVCRIEHLVFLRILKKTIEFGYQSMHAAGVSTVDFNFSCYVSLHQM